MIKNDEFRKLRYYKEIVKASDKENLFDKYSIIKSFVKNISNGKQDLLSQMSFDDEYHLQELFEQISDINILGDDSFELGNASNNVWVKFIAEPDGTFVYISTKVPYTFNHRKFC